jgi:hypothetical protein
VDIPLNEVVYFDATTHNPATGAVSDADGDVSFEVFEEATDTALGVSANMTKRTSKTGNYRGSFTQSTANGFELGKFYSVVVSATVNGIAGKQVALKFRCAAAETTAGVPKVDANVISYAKGMAPHAFVTTIGSVTNQTTFVIADGPPGDDVVNGWRVLFIDASDPHQVSARYVTDYATSGKVLTIDSAPEFTIASLDTIVFFPTSTSTIPTVTNLTNAVTLPTIPSNWITAAGIAANSFQASKFASDYLTAVAAAIWNALTSGMSTAGSIGKKLADWVIGTQQTADVADLITTVGAAGAGLTDLGGMSTTMKAQVNAEADTALSDYGAAKPGDEMDLIDAPNATAVTAIQNGLATGTALQTVDDEIATLQTSIDDVPNNSEFNARSLATADYATAAAQTTAQNDLNLITGTDGVTLATAQANYAPAKPSDVTDARDYLVNNYLETIEERLPDELTENGLMPVDVIRYGGTLQSNGDLPLKIDDVKNVTTKLDTMVQYDEGDEEYKFTVPALENATGGGGSTPEDIATAVRTELATELARIDADITSRLADEDYTAPPSVSSIWTTALTEAYRTTGATGTAAQLLYELIAHLGNSSITSTTKTLKKLDKSTTAKTYTLDDDAVPTAIEETT